MTEFVFNTEWVTLKKECDDLLTLAAADVSNANSRINILQRTLTNRTAKGPEIVTEFDGVNSTLSSVNNWLNLIDDKDLREINEKAIKRIEIRQMNLAKQIDNYTVVARLDVQMNLAVALATLDILNSFITAITARKAALPA